MSSDKPHILYVDDEEHNLTSFTALFRREYTVHTALSGTEGMAILGAHPIEVIVTDQRMPGMTGVQFLERVVKEYPFPIRMVLTGYSDIDAVVGAINKGQAYRYIAKPWDPNDLRMTIEGAVELYRTQKQNRELSAQLKEHNRMLEVRVEERTAELKEKSEELAESYERVTSLNKELRELGEEKKAFLRIAAEDLQKPLHKVLQSSNTISEDLAKQKIDHALAANKTVQANAATMQDILGKIVRVSEIEDQKLQLMPTMCDLTMLAQSVLMEYKERADRHRVSLNFHPSKGSNVIHADIDATYQILDNLISNALKVSPNSSSVDLRFTSSGGTIRCEVEDQGPGISSQEQPLLFRKFSKLEAKTQGEDYGSGLGLSIVKRLVDAQHGRVWCESEAGKGARFIVELPISR